MISPIFAASIAPRSEVSSQGCTTIAFTAATRLASAISRSYFEGDATGPVGAALANPVDAMLVSAMVAYTLACPALDGRPMRPLHAVRLRHRMQWLDCCERSIGRRGRTIRGCAECDGGLRWNAGRAHSTLRRSYRKPPAASLGRREELTESRQARPQCRSTAFRIARARSP